MRQLRALMLGVMGVALGVSSASAYRFGNPGKVAKPGKAVLGVALELGERELEADAGDSGDMDITGLAFEGQYGLGNGLELRGRLIPLTVEWDDGESDISPRMFGLGAGVQWVPGDQRGKLTWGLGAALDYGQGDDKGYDVDYLDFSLNGGVSYAVDKRLDAYGGLSFIQSDVTVEGPGGKADLEMDNPLGLFGGIDFKVDDHWILGAELRLVSETMVSLAGRYAF